MASDCLQCNSTVRPRQEALQCDGCDRWQHRVCGINITRDEYRRMVKQSEGRTWYCTECIPSQTSDHAESTRLSFNLPDPHSAPVAVEITQDDTADQSDNADHHEVPDRSFNISVSFEENSIRNESSIADDSVHNVEPADNVITFTIVDSGTQRGKRKLVDSHGYTYNIKRQRNSTTDWQCTVRNKKVNCTAVVKQTGDSFVPGKGHIHIADPGVLEAVKIKKQVITQAADNVHRPISDIVETALVEHGDPHLPPGSRPKQTNLVRAANRVRQKLRPDEPTDLEFELAYNFIPDDFIVKDVVVDDYRHLVFYTTDQMKVLTDAKTWYLDGTFKIVHQPFVQMFSIHALLKSGDNTKQHHTSNQHLKNLPTTLMTPLNYVSRTWINSKVHKVSSWSVFGQPVRTNNDVEGWHRRLNKKNVDQSPPFYQLITSLHTEAQLLPVQRKLVSEGKLTRFQRRQARTTQSKIFNLWDQYTSKAVSTNRLLKLCSSINGPSRN